LLADRLRISLSRTDVGRIWSRLMMCRDVSGVLSRCRRLAYPRDLDALPALRARIFEDLQDA